MYRKSLDVRLTIVIVVSIVDPVAMPISVLLSQFMLMFLRVKISRLIPPACRLLRGMMSAFSYALLCGCGSPFGVRMWCSVTSSNREGRRSSHVVDSPLVRDDYGGHVCSGSNNLDMMSASTCLHITNVHAYLSYAIAWRATVSRAVVAALHMISLRSSARHRD